MFQISNVSNNTDNLEDHAGTAFTLKDLVFFVTVADANIGSLKYHLYFLNK